VGREVHQSRVEDSSRPEPARAVERAGNSSTSSATRSRQLTGTAPRPGARRRLAAQVPTQPRADHDLLAPEHRRPRPRATRTRAPSQYHHNRRSTPQRVSQPRDRPRPRSSGDRAVASGAMCAGSNPAEGAGSFRARRRQFEPGPLRPRRDCHHPSVAFESAPSLCVLRDLDLHVRRSSIEPLGGSAFDSCSKTARPAKSTSRANSGVLSSSRSVTETCSTRSLPMTSVGPSCGPTALTSRPNGCTTSPDLSALPRPRPQDARRRRRAPSRQSDAARASSARVFRMLKAIAPARMATMIPSEAAVGKCHQCEIVILIPTKTRMAPSACER
jgi:hypothetical protein